jgi:hypothetical protein
LFIDPFGLARELRSLDIINAVDELCCLRNTRQAIQKWGAKVPGVFESRLGECIPTWVRILALKKAMEDRSGYKFPKDCWDKFEKWLKEEHHEAWEDVFAPRPGAGYAFGIGVLVTGDVAALLLAAASHPYAALALAIVSTVYGIYEMWSGVAENRLFLAAQNRQATFTELELGITAKFEASHNVKWKEKKILSAKLKE